MSQQFRGGTKYKGCVNCVHGWVFYTRKTDIYDSGTAEYVGKCGLCRCRPLAESESYVDPGAVTLTENHKLASGLSTGQAGMFEEMGKE